MTADKKSRGNEDVKSTWRRCQSRRCLSIIGEQIIAYWSYCEIESVTQKLKRRWPNVKGACETNQRPFRGCERQAQRHAKQQCLFWMRNKSAARPNKTTQGVTVTDHCRHLLSHPKKFDDRTGVTWLWSSHHPNPAGTNNGECWTNQHLSNEPYFCFKEKTR